ncbi:hypothetical protein LUZ60_003474 [Juncus effusus]|nr:hypothetical protein LUZ60_003474 [Juncus effusus]
MKRATQIVLYLLLSYPIWSLASSPINPAVSSVCSRTHDPKLCTSSSSKYVGSYPVINAKAVLEMHLRAVSKRASAAQGKTVKFASTSPPNVSSALRTCGMLYSNIIDLIGVSLRAIDANDGQTKSMVQISVMQVRQAVQQCDMSFQKMNVKNPMARFDNSLMKMSLNCDDLNTMM